MGEKALLEKNENKLVITSSYKKSVKIREHLNNFYLRVTGCIYFQSVKPVRLVKSASRLFLT